MCLHCHITHAPFLVTLPQKHNATSNKVSNMYNIWYIYARLFGSTEMVPDTSIPEPDNYCVVTTECTWRLLLFLIWISLNIFNKFFFPFTSSRISLFSLYIFILHENYILEILNSLTAALYLPFFDSKLYKYFSIFLNISSNYIFIFYNS